MPNPSQPTISEGAIGAVVRRLQRALRRTPNLGIVVDGVFGPLTETAVTQFQEGQRLASRRCRRTCDLERLAGWWTDANA